MWYEGKVCVVSGASSGLGKALALQMGRQGGKIALLARREDRLRETADQIGALGGESEVHVVDVTDSEAVDCELQRVRQRWGRLDVVIANAGVAMVGRPSRLTPQKVEAVVNVNLLGAIWVLLPALQIMLEQGEGRLVGISSLSGYAGLPQASVYSATKAALNNFLQAVRCAHSHQGVTVTTVCPGFIRTPMTEGSRFPMPFLMEADRAATLILRAVAKGRSEYSFPWIFANLMKFSGLMPNFLVDPMLRRLMPPQS